MNLVDRDSNTVTLEEVYGSLALKCDETASYPGLFIKPEGENNFPLPLPKKLYPETLPF